MMKLTYLKHTLYSLWISMSCVCILSSCSLDEPAQESLKKYTLRLQLTSNGIMTRAGNDWESEYEGYKGTSLENIISSVDLFILDENDNIATRLYALKEPGSSANIFTCDVDQNTPGVSIDNDKAVFSGRIMALANVNPLSSLDPDSKEWNINKLPFKVNFNLTDNNWYIPMWGVEKYKDIELKPNALTELDGISMLRAVSKIVVKLHESVSGHYDIESIKMADNSPELFRDGYTLPNDALSVESTKKLSIEGCFEPVKNAETLTDLSFKIDSDNKSAFTYVSESETEAENPFKFIVSLKSKDKDGVDFVGTLYFSRYDLQNPVYPGSSITNVVRNHIYQFTINLAELQLYPTVTDWVPGGTIHIDMQ